MTDEINEKELQKERKEIITRMLDIQKRFMELERDKGVTEKDLHQNPKGVLKEYKEEHEKLANRLVDIAHQIKGSIRT
tara:strand:- start:751 stop:984 length:234 start_codon:yes stop_codon:yes gene_type:complete